MSKANSSHTISATARAAKSAAPLLTRRSVTAGLAVAVTAIPAVGLAKGAEDATELNALIKAHRGAFRAFGVAIDREQAARDLLRKGEPIVDFDFLRTGNSLYIGQEDCTQILSREFENCRSKLKMLERIMPDAAKEAEAILDAKQADDMAVVDQAFAEYNAAETTRSDASDAEEHALTAICSYRCRSPEETRIKAEYLLTTVTLNDCWENDAKAVLKSLSA